MKVKPNPITVHDPTGSLDGVTLYAHQRRLVEAMPRFRALVWETGTGKSIAAIALASRYPAVSLAVVVCPKGLTVKWRREMSQFCPKHWMVLSKEEFKKHAQSIPRTGTCLILDEGHHALGMSSALSNAVRQFARHTHVFSVLVLTATPYRSSPWDVYVLHELLGKKVSYWTFRRRFFAEVRMGARTVPVVREAMLPMLSGMVREVADVVKLDDCVDVPPQVHETVHVAPTPEQVRAVAGMTEWEPLLRCGKEHQIMGGAGGVATNKDDALLALLDTNPRAVVVAKYREEMERLQAEVLPKLGRPVFVIHGGVKAEDRDAALAAARSADSFVLLVNASTVEGWRCERAPLMVFYSHSWSLVDYVQALGRVQDVTHAKKNTYVSIVVEGTVDQAVADCLKGKTDFHAEIYQGNQTKL